MSITNTIFPLVMTEAGPQPTPPATINASIISQAQSMSPGLTANLPGILVEDIASTDTAAVALANQFMVDNVNSITPLGANAFILNEIGQMVGVPIGQASNTSVYVQFGGDAGFVLAQGFIVSDGNYQYTVQDGGIIGSGGVSPLLYCLATQAGTWSVPVGTVTQIVTSVPSPYTLTVTNPSAGTPSAAAQTEENYRAQVLPAYMVTSQGTPNYLKTLLGNVAGVQSRLVSVRSPAAGQWEVICGGGDPYQVAYAIYGSGLDISTLVGSTMTVSGITNAANGVVTTALNHGLATGQTTTIAGATGLTALNGVLLTVTVLTPTTFETNVNTTSDGAYTGNGYLTPNARNISATVIDTPDSYTVPFVNPPPQTVTLTLTWNTSIPAFTQSTAVQQAGQPALVAYLNSIPVGAPINLFELQNAFQIATAAIIPTDLLTRMVFSVAINGIGVSPASGTGLFYGDPESYFSAAVNAATIIQG